MTANFIVGLLIGMAMSVPFGPIGAVCLNRIFQRGKWAGMASGLGLALGDSFFAALAILGLSQVSDFLLEWQHWLEVVAGAFILASGIAGYLKEQPKPDIAISGIGAAKDAVSMFLMTIANPQTVLGFSMALAGMISFYHLDTAMDAAVLLGGIFCGSIFWWVAISIAFERLRDRMPQMLSDKLYRISSLLLMTIGALLISHGLFSRFLPLQAAAL